MMAEPAPELPVDPDPLAHGDLPCKGDVAVAPFRVRGKCPFGFAEEYPDTLAGDLFYGRLF